MNQTEYVFPHRLNQRCDTPSRGSWFRVTTERSGEVAVYEDKEGENQLVQKQAIESARTKHTN